jgi:hypothetical protein
MAFALEFRLDVNHAGLRELLETLGENCARYERRGAEQLAEGPGAEAQLPQDDGGPTVAEDFGCFGDGAELAVGDHGAIMFHPAASVQVRFTYLSGGARPPLWHVSNPQASVDGRTARLDRSGPFLDLARDELCEIFGRSSLRRDDPDAQAFEPRA